MTAEASTLPPDPENWAFEFKWDGLRTLASFDGAELRLATLADKDITSRYPELQSLKENLHTHRAVLDGEILTLGTHRPDFILPPQQLPAAPAALRPRRGPVIYMIFDLLHLDGRSLLDEPYTQRRAALESLNLTGPHWQTPPWSAGQGREMLEAARRHGLEGVVAKRLSSLYCPGERSDAWRQIKVRPGQEFVIGGWLPIKDDPAQTLGALLLGYYSHGLLRYVGKVGTGFSQDDRRRLRRLLERYRRFESPFADYAGPLGTCYAEPELVAQVEFQDWSSEGLLRQASYQGLRTDKDPRRIARGGQT